METDRYTRHFLGKDKDELLRGLMSDGLPTSQVHEQQKMAIFVRCTEDLEASIRNFTDSNNRLSKQILILNVIFGICNYSASKIVAKQGLFGLGSVS